MDIEKKYGRLLEIFKEISKIPRNSCKEEGLADYVCTLAKEKNLEYRKDSLYNVIVKKPASSGYEGRNAIIFQAHLDMVCEKTIDSMHDFEKDSIEIIESEDTYTAKDTTLGADDGIGVSYLLLLLEDDEIKHPDIYLLFTTQEEIGMDGAKYFDYEGIKAKYLINIDGEESNEAIVGCAGGSRIKFEKNPECVSTDEKDRYRLSISGLRGGHSGVDIDKGRENSNLICAKILSRLEDVGIISFVGGNKDNAIPNSTICDFVTSSMNVQEIVDDMMANMDLVDEDKNIKIDLCRIDEAPDYALSISESKSALDMILGLKQGVIEYSKDKEGLVETSGNVGIVNVSCEKSIITELLRSSDDEKREVIEKDNECFAKERGYSYEVQSSYPGWKYNPNSNLEKIYEDTYKEVTGGEIPMVQAIHAGVECGMIYKKMPELELISIGPDIEDVHTTNETLYIKSCLKILKIILLMIEKL